MPFNSAGIFTREQGRARWQDDAANGTKIEADEHDSHDNDIGDALSRTILKDGFSTITANIPWGGKKIVNLGGGTADTDAANIGDLKALKDFSTGIRITGSSTDGYITFGPSSTGTLGLSWTQADLFWGAKPYKAGETSNRLVLNNTAAATAGSDVVVMDESGRINNAGVLTNNLSYVDSAYRTISPGWGTLMSYASGVVTFQSNDVSTITNNYAAVTLREFFRAFNSAGSSYLTLTKSASAKTTSIRTQVGSERRWELHMGNATAESGTAVGSDLQLVRFDNAGASLGNALLIERSTGKATFGGELVSSNLTTTDPLMTVGPTANGSSFAMQRAVTNGNSTFLIYGGRDGGNGSYLQLFGDTYNTTANAADIILGSQGAYRYWFDYSANTHHWRSNSADIMTAAPAGLSVTGGITASGIITANTNFDSTSTTCTLSATNGGKIQLMPDGTTGTSTMTVIDTNGSINVCNGLSAATGGVTAGLGLRGKTGQAGAYSNWMNMQWNGTSMLFYANTSLVATYTPSSDYRIKKDIAPLPSMWDRIKALKPISYKQKAYQEWTEENDERWGFVAHELQDGLSPSVATGIKDGPDVQSVNPLTLIAALTKALQEAMARIEALEAAA